MIALARPENMSPAFINNDDIPPPGYDVVCKEHMPSPEYETVPLALAGKRTLTSENPPPLPPPMIRGDSEAPDLPPPYNPAMDNKSVVDLLGESCISQGAENQSVNRDVDTSVKRDHSVSDVEHDDTTEEAIGSTEVQPEMDQMLEGEVVDTKDKSVSGGAEDGAGNSADHGGQEAMIAVQVRRASLYSTSKGFSVTLSLLIVHDCGFVALYYYNYACMVTAQLSSAH